MYTVVVIYDAKSNDYEYDDYFCNRKLAYMTENLCMDLSKKLMDWIILGVYMAGILSLVGQKGF